MREFWRDSRFAPAPMTSDAAYLVNIRPYVTDDSTSLIALFRDSVRSTCPRDYTEIQVTAWAPENIDAEQFGSRSEAKTTWVAEAQGRIVGFCDLELDGHIDMLCVHSEYQKCGVAGRMLDHIELVARQQSLTRLYTEASITAHPVFEARGFHCITSQSVTVRGISMINFRMEKHLSTC